MWRFCGSDSERPKRVAFAGSSTAACESEVTAKPLLYFCPIKDSLICRKSISLNHWRSHELLYVVVHSYLFRFFYRLQSVFIICHYVKYFWFSGVQPPFVNQFSIEIGIKLIIIRFFFKYHFLKKFFRNLLLYRLCDSWNLLRILPSTLHLLGQLLHNSN